MKTHPQIAKSSTLLIINKLMMLLFLPSVGLLKLKILDLQLLSISLVLLIFFGGAKSFRCGCYCWLTYLYSKGRQFGPLQHFFLPQFLAKQLFLWGFFS